MATKQLFTSISDDIEVNKIYDIREQKVMLDSDLAEFYGVETKRINEQVGRNVDRFPADFMFQLSEDEWKNLKSQFGLQVGAEEGNFCMFSPNTVYLCYQVCSIVRKQYR